jgi:hypothetical protein
MRLCRHPSKLSASGAGTLTLPCRAACVNKHARPTTYWAFDLLDPSHLVRNGLGMQVCMVLQLNPSTASHVGAGHDDQQCTAGTGARRRLRPATVPTRNADCITCSLRHRLLVLAQQLASSRPRPSLLVLRHAAGTLQGRCCATVLPAGALQCTCCAGQFVTVVVVVLLPWRWSAGQVQLPQHANAAGAACPYFPVLGGLHHRGCCNR